MTPPPATERASRTSVMLAAYVFRDAGAQAVKHRVVNLSATGLCIAHPEVLAEGDRLTVTIGQIDHAAATVVWHRNGQAGIRFDQPIDVAAARSRRGDAPVVPLAAGWLADRENPYRRS